MDGVAKGTDVEGRRERAGQNTIGRFQIVQSVTVEGPRIRPDRIPTNNFLRSFAQIPPELNMCYSFLEEQTSVR